ncbi:MAG: amino acid ABC transporter permease [Acidisphaera sp.]|nr:amino acid ABC transporter permease [Acidisphaera sp.]
MAYVFQWGVVADNLPRLLYGAEQTVVLSASAMALGLGVALACTAARTLGPLPLRWAVRAYVELIRNTPFLVQLFIIYFSLPALGIRMRADQAAVLGMTINVAAYAAEIFRGGIEAIPRGQIEAGRALGLSRLQIFRLIVIGPAIRIVYPALSSQFVLLMLASSVVSTISAEDLTAITNSLQSTTFRSFEFYFAATLLYLLMALAFRIVLRGVERLVFAGRPL